MSLPLQELGESATNESIVRMTFADLGQSSLPAAAVVTSLIPARALEAGEQYRFHFDMTKCIGCRSCEIACNEQNGNPADIRWRRIGEIEGGTYPDTHRHYLSMGCNHCLNAECIKGCPVEAYTKDPVTGVVLHSATACIGCQYCVWNCPYSVPQFNPERGVVGKCDMCYGRLTDGREPACVSACPEAAIEIEIVDTTAWRIDYATAESPGMPAAGHTISTTRITLPPNTTAKLERVDVGRIQPEHAHLSLVFMTTLIQSVTGSLIFALLFRPIQPMLLTLLLCITAVALSISVFHLGRPAYAWRALKMWRRSWLSREVLLFGLFFGVIAMFTLATWLLTPSIAAILRRSLPQHLQTFCFVPSMVTTIGCAAAIFGVAGTLASAFIYLVPARPAWNMIHTPIDFILSSLLIGSTLPVTLNWMVNAINRTTLLQTLHLQTINAFPPWLTAVAAIPWIANHAIRLIRLNRSSRFEERATAELLGTQNCRSALIVTFALAAAAILLSFCGAFAFATMATFAAVFIARYLFFVSVVPLNMALTFTCGGSHQC